MAENTESGAGGSPGGRQVMGSDGSHQEDDNVTIATLTHWGQLKKFPDELENRILRWISCGYFIHVIARKIGVPENYIHEFLSATQDRRDLWFESDELGKSVIRSRIRGELSRMAFADIRDLYGETGDLKKISDWPDDVAKSVTSIYIQDGVTKDGASYTNTKLKLESKLKANELLGKEVGMFIDKKEIKLTSLEDVLDASWEDTPNPEDADVSESSPAEIDGEVNGGSSADETEKIEAPPEDE